MLKYLIVPLADDAVSFCHYDRNTSGSKLIDLELLEKIIFWSMKENLNIQFLFPDCKLPIEYHRVIDTVDHTSIASATSEDNTVLQNADVIVFDSWDSISSYPFKEGLTYVIRTTKEDFFNQYQLLKPVISKADKVQIILKDIQAFKEPDFVKYREVLDYLVQVVYNEIANGRNIHFNLLTNRVLLNKMNNCGAGYEHITIAPNGNFYICPAFYNPNINDNIQGTLKEGLDIKNRHLYKLDYAPICRHCDAYQCRRCIWLNKKTTLEVNTPSHEQCVVSHIERNASKVLADMVRKLPGFSEIEIIKQIDYLDPFDLLEIPHIKPNN